MSTGGEDVLAAGSTIGGHEILGLLGSGGMGVVYRARDRRLDRDVAIKVLPGRYASDPARLRRFEQEVRATCLLNHPHVVSVHDVGTDAGRPYIVTELLEGETLRQRLRQGPLPVRKAVEVARHVASALAAAHDKGIVHRDLKPENVFVLSGGHVKVLDFGLARIMEPERGGTDSQATTSGLTHPGTVLGTVGYMSPEQVRGQPADHRTDVFALGVVLHEMLSGERPFRGESSVETMNAILKDEPPPLIERRAAVSPALDAIVRHCLEKRPEDRFQSARDLAFQLETVSVVTSTSGQPKAIQRSRRGFVLGALVLLGAAALASAFLVGSERGERRERTAAAAVRWQRVTFRRGNVLSARFAPEGDTVVYGAAWEGRPAEVFVGRFDSPEARPLGLPRADVAAVSRTGELAVMRRDGDVPFTWMPATLAVVPLGGGAPKDLFDDVGGVDFGQDGEMAVSRSQDGKPLHEFPIGRAVAGAHGNPRVSPDGQRVAWVGGTITVIDRAGTAVSAPMPKDASVTGVAWAPGGESLWVSAVVSSMGAATSVLEELELDGTRRRLLTAGHQFLLHDVAPDGRALVEVEADRTAVACLVPTPGGEEMRSLSWFDRTTVQGLTADGSHVLLSEHGSAVAFRNASYLRPIDAGPAVSVADGGVAVSPDGRFVLAVHREAREVALVPVGAGESRTVRLGDVEPVGASLLPGAERAVVMGKEREGAAHAYVVDFASGAVDRIEGPELRPFDMAAASPDGLRVALSHRTATQVLTLSTGQSEPVAQVERGEWIAGWTADSRELLVFSAEQLPVRVHAVDVRSGARRLVRELPLPPAEGLFRVGDVRTTPDLSTWCQGYQQVHVSYLAVISGLQQW